MPPQLRKGRIVHYVHGAADPYPGWVDPAIILRVIGADRSLVALSVFTEHGATFRDAVRVADGPASAVRGGAFWPELGIDTVDTDYIKAEAIELPGSGGEAPVEAVSRDQVEIRVVQDWPPPAGEPHTESGPDGWLPGSYHHFPTSEGLPASKVGSALDDHLAARAARDEEADAPPTPTEIATPAEPAAPVEPPAPQEPDEPPPTPAAPI